MNEYQKRFVALLKTIFELDKSDLDFGIYRIINIRQREIVDYFENRLPKKIQEILAPFANERTDEIKQKLAKIESDVESMGMTIDALQDNTPKKQEYIALLKQLSQGADMSALESDVYSALYSFFNRYYDEGDFISKRRYKEGVYAIPYEGEEVKLTIKDILSTKKGWQVIISFGALTFIINACMGSMAMRYITLGGGEPTIWLQAVKYLSIGAFLGIPMSYVFGLIDDKVGTVKAAIVLGLCELMPILGLMLQPEGGSKGLMLLWGFGVACMTGGVPTLHPCIMAFAYGRREYQAANRIIMAIQLIPSAVAAQIMVGFMQRGRTTTAYIMLLIVLAVGIITLLTMLGMKDANAADRDYGKKAA